MGTATVSVTGTGGYTGYGGSMQFAINSKKIAAPEEMAGVIYDRTKQTPTVKVMDGSAALTENTDYTVSWDDSGLTDAKTYTVTVTGKGNYSGARTVTYVISPEEPAPSNNTTLYVAVAGVVAVLAVAGVIVFMRFGRP